MSFILQSANVVLDQVDHIAQVTEESRPSSSLTVQIARSKLSGSDPRESPESAAKDGAGERKSSVEK